MPQSITQTQDQEMQLFRQALTNVYQNDDARIDQLIDDLSTLKKKLIENEIVLFYYKKKSGEIRKAYGTRFHDVIGNETKELSVIRKSSGRSKPELCFPYFDLVKNNWRSFIITNFVKIEDNFSV